MSKVKVAKIKSTKTANKETKRTSLWHGRQILQFLNKVGFIYLSYTVNIHADTCIFDTTPLGYVTILLRVCIHILK